ncbi:MAG: amidohydrolase [Acidobacteria bacterium]|nr:amidohydrolase [Acidobacteriota bacterium]
MNHRWHLLLISLLLVLLGGACSQTPEILPADLLITNARILTIDSAQPHASAVAIKGERIVFVGSTEDGQARIGEKTRVIDAGGRRVVPGFNDAHLHFTSGGESLMQLDFRYVHDVAAIQQMVKEKVAQAKPGELISGRGWEHETFPDKKWPTKEILDEVAPDNPVALRRADGHSVWVNSYVLRESGITRDTPDPPNGTIVRDARTGEPTGIFKEGATDLLKISSTVELTPAEQEARRDQALELALAEARRCGVTSIQHLTGSFDRFQRFQDEGRLTLRATINMPMPHDETGLAEMEELRRRYPRTNDWIRFGYLKEFIDGTLGSGTALMFEPFLDDPSTSGLPMMPYDEFEQLVLAADKHGFQIGVHAIGTKGNHWLLNAYQKARAMNGARDSRHRSEHAQLLRLDDIPRFADLGVVASMQPTHCITDKRFAEKRIGLERCAGAYAWQKLLQADAHIAFGTDWPVEPLDPLEGLYAAVTRKDRAGEPGDGWFPEEKLSMEKAIELYTLGAAYAEFMEDRKGKIAVGYLADMIVFEDDLLTMAPERIMDARVDLTIVGGRMVYERPE